MKKTQLNQWAALQAVVDEGSFQKAAVKLHRSQSSVSYAVQSLEDGLGVELLVVQGRKAELTEAGEALLRRSRSLTAMAQDIEQFAVNLKQGWEAEVHVSFETIYPFADLMKVMSDFESQSRGTRVQLHETILSGSSEAITQKRVDIAISPIVPQGFLGDKLGVMEFVLVACSSHPLALRDDIIEENELSQYLQLVIRDSGKDHGKGIDERKSERKDGGWLKAEKRWTVGHFATAISLLKGGTGFAWIPKHLIELELDAGHLRPINLAHKASFELSYYLVIPSSSSIGPAAQLLGQLIKKHHLGGDSESS